MALRAAWSRAPPKCMPPSEQCKLWGLREALRMLGADDTQYQHMAGRVFVNGQDDALGNEHPGRQSVRELFQRVDTDFKGWYPGRTSGAKRGAKTQLTPGKRKTIAQSMMAAKKRGARPCYDLAKARCPTSTANPKTGEAFSRNVINVVLTSDCYDKTPDRPWEFRYGAKRRALLPEDQEQRADWGRRLLSRCRTHLCQHGVSNEFPCVTQGPCRKDLLFHRLISP